jgi:hypothetical protein
MKKLIMRDALVLGVGCAGISTASPFVWDAERRTRSTRYPAPFFLRCLEILSQESEVEVAGKDNNNNETIITTA